MEKVMTEKWRHENFKNPYGEEWYTSACQHQYNLGEAYETGYNDCLDALFKMAKESPTGRFCFEGREISVYCHEETEVIKEVKMGKSLEFWIHSYPQPGEEYTTSYPTNILERLRLGIARTFIKVGFRLLLNNGKIQITDSTGSTVRNI